ncbi:MAG TPA: hypothetical protein VMS00_07830 [Acidimicrobiales bacterium]|nr:hypothetical protein [Acidimicrobiales bacterium]
MTLLSKSGAPSRRFDLLRLAGDLDDPERGPIVEFALNDGRVASTSSMSVR